MRPVFERLRPRLRAFRDEEGREIFDLPPAPRPDPDEHAPVRLIPDYDNILLAHADRTRIMPAGRHLGMFSSNGVMQGAVLADGFVRAMWVPRKSTLEISPFIKPLTKAERDSIEAESRHLMKFLAPGEEHDVKFGSVRP